jgi:hypothetical protein
MKAFSSSWQNGSPAKADLRRGVEGTVMKSVKWLALLGQRRLAAAVAFAAIVTCAACTPQMFGAMLGHKPGDTIDVAGHSSAYISFVYTHTYPEEFPIVMDRAEAWCRMWGNRAMMSQNVQINLDRSTASFTCTK